MTTHDRAEARGGETRVVDVGAHLDHVDDVSVQHAHWLACSQSLEPIGPSSVLPARARRRHVGRAQRLFGAAAHVRGASL